MLLDITTTVLSFIVLMSLATSGVSNNNFLGTIIHPQGGNISLHLLKDGFARIVDWSIGNVTQQREQYVVTT